MTDAVAARLGEARRALEQALTQNQHERVLALCDQLLEAPADQLSLGDNMDDRDLLRARLYQARSTAGAHLAQTETALSDIEQIPERLRDEQVCFLQAYLLYRTRRLKDALQLIPASLSTESGDVMTDEARRWGLLRAQVAYAQGDLAQAAKVWRQLIVHGPDSNETAAIWSNWIAALSSRLDSKADNDDWGEAIAAIQNARIFEGFFNLSIWHTSQRKYESAMRWLDEARALAIAELGTDRHHDVARIDVQRACLFQLQDQDQRAQALYRDLGTWRGTRALVPVDGSADWVRAFNASVLEGDLAALLDSDPSSWTLTECQRQLLLWNRAIAALSSNKAQIALATVEEMTFDPLDRIVLKACALDARGRHQEAEQMLLEHRLSMHAAQMRLQRGDVGGALALLEQSPGPSLQSKSNDLPVRNQPACVLFRATWYRRQGYLDKAIQTLIEAASDALPIRRLYAELLLESKQFGSVLDSIPNDA
ncbi:hypothetical protein F1559_002878 [Cyanidiococcus yangmingshanensis]|uniref:Uncharacterized protein n=1 Tax=Cyanidiococcus yangmingshanensis TaxID=2690220 RepID=A0A7J7IQK1_9RHOD|nr:hypothetical protein F1559_002878 [Cyanidiococcus yangmingshanensis]